MKFCVIHQQTSHNAHSPRRVVEQSTGQGVAWINRYLDREYVRRIADTTLRTYAHNLLHFVRWWERSEERRVGKECRSRWSRERGQEKLAHESGHTTG